MDTGKVYLIPVCWDKSYYPSGERFDKTTISKGKFKISGLCPYPSMFFLCAEVDSVPIYISDYFIVDFGAQRITCDKDSIREIPKIENKWMSELKNDYLPAVGMEQTGQKSEVFLNYAKSHPKSFVILWKLVEVMINRGYEPVLDSAYQSLSDSIKSTFTAKVLADKMTTMRTLAIGASFPDLTLLDSNMNKAKIYSSIRHGKYTLVDFWYSHCGPCLREFEELKKIYEENSPYGFTIAGISIDDRKSIEDWKRVIREHNLSWNQYLDIGGNQVSDLSIEGFPALFLLDGQGKIIQRDPDLKSLTLFLKKNLH